MMELTTFFNGTAVKQDVDDVIQFETFLANVSRCGHFQLFSNTRFMQFYNSYRKKLVEFLTRLLLEKRELSGGEKIMTII